VRGGGPRYRISAMTPPGILRRAHSAPLAALLLALQSVTGGAVALIHAAERSAAPTAIEREHGSSCPVTHDAARCAACQHSVQGPTASAPRWAAAGLEDLPSEPPPAASPASTAAAQPNSRSPPPARA